MLKKILLIFLISYSIDLHATGLNNNIDGDFSVYWLRDIEVQFDAKTISKETFKPVTGLINNGFENGVYWLKIVPKTGLEFNHVFEIPFIHTTKVELYSNTESIKPRPNTRFILFELTRKYEGNTLYARVNCTKAGLIPITILHQNTYRQSINYFSSSSYYIILLCVLILHLICYYEFGKIGYLNYTYMLITFGSSLAYRDGIYRLFLNTQVHEHIESFFNLATAFALAIFTYHFLEHKRYLPKFKWWGIASLIVPSISYAIYLYNPSLVWYAITENLTILSLTAYYASSWFIYKKTFFAKAYAWAYFPVLILTYDFYNSGIFGFEITGVDINIFRISGIFEMTIFSYIIIYRARKQIEENSKLKIDLDYKDKALNVLKMDVNGISSDSNDILNDDNVQKTIHNDDNKFNEHVQNLTKSQLLTRSLKSDKEWQSFVEIFEQVHIGYLDRLKQKWPNLTRSETKLIVLSHLKLKNNDIAIILKASPDAIRQLKSRLGKKIKFDKKTNLIEFANHI